MKLGDKLQMYYNEEASARGGTRGCLAAAVWQRFAGVASCWCARAATVPSSLMPSRLLQLKCWLMPGEEDERRRQIEEEKKTAAPPTMSAATSSASLASKAAEPGGRPPLGPSSGSRLGVSGRYAAAGVFGGAAAQPADSSGEAASSVMGGLRPTGMFGGAAAAAAGGAPAMFKPPSGVFTPATAVPEEAVAESPGGGVAAVGSATEAAAPAGGEAAGSRAGSRGTTPTAAQVQQLQHQAMGGYAEAVAAAPPAQRADSLDVDAAQAGGWGYSAAYAAVEGQFVGANGASVAYSAEQYTAVAQAGDGTAAMEVRAGQTATQRCAQHGPTGHLCVHMPAASRNPAAPTTAAPHAPAALCAGRGCGLL